MFWDAFIFLLEKPDPKRFSVGLQSAPNWNGELEGRHNKKDRSIAERVVRVNGEGICGTFEFPDASPFDGIVIDERLTADDIRGLQARGYRPSSPTYSVAKKYFAKNPNCSKKELAENSKPPEGAAMAVETAKDVIAVFRANVLK
jgi:hypothetical protein